MSRRIVTFGALAAILIAAVLIMLTILDVVSFGEARESLVKTVSVIAVATAAVVLMAAVGRFGKRGLNQNEE